MPTTCLVKTGATRRSLPGSISRLLCSTPRPRRTTPGGHAQGTTAQIWVLAAVGALLLSVAVSAELAIVVNRDGELKKLSKSHIKRIYLGRLPKLGTIKIVPINLPLQSEEGKAFLKEYVGMSPTAYKEYWVTKQIKGEGTAPMVQRTSDNVKAMISQIPGAVGYVPVGDVDDSVARLNPK